MPFPIIPGIPGGRVGTGMAVLLLVIAILSLAYCQGRTDGGNAKQAQIDKARIEQAKKELRAGNAASVSRTRDALADKDKELQDEKVIAAAPGGAVSPADRAVACRRLREAYPGAVLPAGC